MGIICKAVFILQMPKMQGSICVSYLKCGVSILVLQVARKYHYYKSHNTLQHNNL